MGAIEVGQKVVIDKARLQQLVDALKKRDYPVIGPTLREQAIVYDELSSLPDLPLGLPRHIVLKGTAIRCFLAIFLWHPNRFLP